ncbi:MAG: glycosyltransferase [Xanthomonadales bacterium]|nr:glycosyltransferase [Xanthomonadales bacterium]
MSQAPNKQVSIILSCFNGSDLIEGYIDSLLAAGILDVCCLIAVNFPESHQSPVFVERQLQRFPDLLLLNQSEDLSLYDAWNIGIKQATTRFVSNLNLDDRVTADYYSYAVESLDSYSADIFSSFSVMTAKIGVKLENSNLQNHLDDGCFDKCGIARYGLPEFVSFNEGKVHKRNPPHCAPVWRTQLHQELGYFNSRCFDFAADYEFWLRCAARGFKFILSNKQKTIFYCAKGTASDRFQHEDNISIVNDWLATFPPANYHQTHLGEWHDKLHHCVNLKCIFSSRDYFNHLADNLVSLVVVAHENPELILECLHSIKSQTYPLFECIVVLDNDNDNQLGNIIRGEYKNDARFMVLSQSQKRERNYCRNLGIELATGNWISIIDGDDSLPRDSLESRVKLAKTTKDIVFGWLEIAAENHEQHTIKFAQVFKFTDLRTGWPSHCTLLIPKNILGNTRYPSNIADITADPSAIAGEDVKFMMELMKNNPLIQMVNCNKPAYTYRRHFSSSYKKRQLSITQVIKTVIYYHGIPDSVDLVYKNSIAERVTAYMFWLGFSLMDRDGSITSKVLVDAVDPEIVKLSVVLSPATISKVEKQFIEDLKRLNVYDTKVCIAIVDLVKQASTAVFKHPELSNTTQNTKSINLAMTQTKKSRTVNGKTQKPDVTNIGGLQAKSFDPLKIDFQRLLRWKNRHVGEKCILMCNGPSLNKVEFNKIDLEQYTVFGLNKIFLGFESLGVLPKYIAAVNSKVLDQSTETYKGLDVIKFLSNRVNLKEIPQSPYTYYINSAKPPPQPPRFSTDIAAYVNEGWTVTHVALQIIYYMGFAEVYIVGMDHKFSQHVEGKENQSSIIEGDDVDHFHPDYFGQGKSWDFPDLVNSEISYTAALKTYQADQRNIYDCTINGACTIFPKMDIIELYR